MDDLIAFVRAQLDTDEKRERSHRTFKGWPPRDPCPECGRPVADVTVTQRHDAAEVEFDPCGDVMAGDEFFKRYGQDAADPVVLADIDSKRLRLDLLADAIRRGHDDYDLAAELLPLEALPYAGRPGYQEKWRP